MKLFYLENCFVFSIKSWELYHLENGWKEVSSIKLYLKIIQS
jgi:hypothetical protein